MCNDLLEGMPLVGLLDCLQHVLIYAEGHSHGKGQQRTVRQHGHHGAAREGHQQRQARAQRRARPRR